MLERKPEINLHARILKNIEIRKFSFVCFSKTFYCLKVLTGFAESKEVLDGIFFFFFRPDRFFFFIKSRQLLSRRSLDFIAFWFDRIILTAVYLINILVVKIWYSWIFYSRYDISWLARARQLCKYCSGTVWSNVHIFRHTNAVPRVNGGTNEATKSFELEITMSRKQEKN